ncbi:hypothetical protein PUR28_15520 [Streptomyces sp. BE308]|uniref:hypothetical protein n=1 Tax=Streptomyces sp. BE308 TaxID=3002529 RepID=UPI002E7865E6|nr:hypothetical protein [Streptomyces sp. BE308]MEE1792163.1 hypothetical protein [Streptomyces sp. BE308]
MRPVVGFSGAGRTTRAANAAAHCPQPVTHFDVVFLPAASVPGALAREPAAWHPGTEAGFLPAAAGIEVLRAVQTLRVQAETECAVVIDNVHLLDSADVRLLVGALPTARPILWGHPRPEPIPLAAHLGISTYPRSHWTAGAPAPSRRSSAAKAAPWTVAPPNVSSSLLPSPRVCRCTYSAQHS